MPLIKDGTGRPGHLPCLPGPTQINDWGFGEPEGGALRAATPDQRFDTTCIWQTEPRATAQPHRILDLIRQDCLFLVAAADMHPPPTLPASLHLRTRARMDDTTRTFNLLLTHCSPPTLIPSPAARPSSSDQENAMLCALPAALMASFAWLGQWATWPRATRALHQTVRGFQHRVNACQHGSRLLIPALLFQSRCV